MFGKFDVKGQMAKQILKVFKEGDLLLKPVDISAKFCNNALHASRLKDVMDYIF